jgi:DnaK suppressor protein
VSIDHALCQPVLLTDELTLLRRGLEKCRQDRLQQLSLLGNVPATDGDPVAIARRQSVRQILAMIDVALARMDLGTYGQCVHCSSVIPAARLELVPYIDGCVDCLRSLAPGR